MTREILDQGEFKNVTPEYLTNQVDGTDGFTITGKANNEYLPSCGYGQLSSLLRWDYELNFDDVSYIKFYAKKNVDYGTVKVIVSDGLKYLSGCSVPEEEKSILYPIIYNNESFDIFNYIYSKLDNEWHEYILDVRGIVGEHIISFIGGYNDKSGTSNDSTSYSNIRFIK